MNVVLSDMEIEILNAIQDRGRNCEYLPVVEELYGHFYDNRFVHTLHYLVDNGVVRVTYDENEGLDIVEVIDPKWRI